MDASLSRDRGSHSFEPDRTQWEFPYARYANDTMEGPKNMEFMRLETGVNNGDCLLACFAASLEAMHDGCIVSRDFNAPAAKLRIDLINWIAQHWERPLFFNPDLKYHEIMHNSHDVAIPKAERKKVGPWPDDPVARLKVYQQHAQTYHFCDAEMMAFSEMMHDRGLPILFRTWRAHDPKNPQKGSFVSATPTSKALQERGVREAVVVDLEHTGALDSRFAHYKILNSGSLEDLIKVCNRPRQNHKRPRVIE